MKGLINIQNDNKKCFLWCHVRYLNCNGKKLSRITKKDKEISERLNYDSIKFPICKKNFLKISVMNKININVFSYEDLLLINNNYVLIKDFNRLMLNKTKSKNKKWFCKCCLQCFSSKKNIK